MSRYYTRFTTEFCDIILVGDQNGLTNLHLETGEGKRMFQLDDKWARNDEFFTDVKRQVLLYLSGNLQDFEVKLNMKGTEFQKKVWNVLSQIPYGQVRTYGEIANQLGNRNASRAVGMANGKNPVPLIVPCHRVIGANGTLTGFASGLTIKEKLLNIEGLNFSR